MVLRLIDLETTGTDPKTDKIVEIASADLVRVTEHNPLGLTPKSVYELTNLQEHLVDPGRPIPPEATAVHHIIDRDVAGKPKIEEVIDLYKGADAYIAHNCAFEKSFLEDLLGAVVWVCPYRVALRIYPDATGHSNQVLRYWLGIVEPFGRKREEIDPHRALSDCIVTGAVFSTMIGKAPWGQMVAWSSEPPLHTYCRFGKKHSGKRWDAIAEEDPSYLTWIIEKSDLDADTKWNAEYWLRNRRNAA